MGCRPKANRCDDGSHHVLWYGSTPIESARHIRILLSCVLGPLPLSAEQRGLPGPSAGSFRIFRYDQSHPIRGSKNGGWEVCLTSGPAWMDDLNLSNRPIDLTHSFRTSSSRPTRYNLMVDRPGDSTLPSRPRYARHPNIRHADPGSANRPALPLP